MFGESPVIVRLIVEWEKYGDGDEHSSSGTQCLPNPLRRCGEVIYVFEDVAAQDGIEASLELHRCDVDDLMPEGWVKIRHQYFVGIVDEISARVGIEALHRLPAS